jgi:hypothetical protein
MRARKPMIPVNRLRELHPGVKNIRTYLHADLSIIPADRQPQTRKRGKYLVEIKASYPKGGSAFLTPHTKLGERPLPY